MAAETQVDRADIELQPISEIVRGLDLDADEVELFGRDKAKIGLGVLERLATRPNGKLVAVTAITPTKAGEGKTTTAISLTEGLGHIGESSLVCLREPSVGPTLGAKGGGTGAGRAQVVPGEDINLHFRVTCTRSPRPTTCSRRPSTRTSSTGTASESTRPRSPGAAVSTSKTACCAGSPSGSARARRSRVSAGSTSLRPPR